MSVLIYKGDTTDNFGKYLPTPYIEKVEIHDDGGYEITFALFLLVNPDEDIDSVIERLNAVDEDGNRILTSYILLAFNKSQTRLDNFLDGRRNVFRLYETFKGTDSSVSRTKLDVLDFFTNAEITDDFYDEGGNRIIKYSYCYGCSGTAGSFVTDIGSTTMQTSFGGATAGYITDVSGRGDRQSSQGGYQRGRIDATPPKHTTSTKAKAARQKAIIDARAIAGAKAIADAKAIGSARAIAAARATAAEAEVSVTEQAAVEPADVYVEEETDTDLWNAVNNFWVFAFSSTYDYFNNEGGIDSELENAAFFRKRISDVAYERVFEDRQLVTKSESHFFDFNNAIYNGKSLRSINGTYHKAETITHDKIIDDISGLLARHKPKKKTPLKKIMDNIYYILNTYRDDASLLVQLNMLRRMFPSKNGATKVGKLYFRYKKIIFVLNRALQREPKLSKKLIRNPKIFDMRTVTSPQPPRAPWVDFANHPEYYLYNRGLVGRTAMYSLPRGSQVAESAQYDTGNQYTTSGGKIVKMGGIDDYDIQANALSEISWDHGGFDAIVRNAGYFFFDYEKALRKTANINQIVDVGKLIKWGIPTDYKSFRISSAAIRRRLSEQSPHKRVQITSELDEDVAYPVTRLTEVDDNSTKGSLSIPAPGFYSDFSPEGEESKLVLSSQENMHLTVRNFEPLQKRGVSGKLPDYRLVCFEFQDFMDDDIAVSRDRDGNLKIDSYDTEVVIVDNSIEILKQFINKYEKAMTQLLNYKDETITMFAYDETSGLFNDFFVDGISATYSGNEAEAPWYRAPVIYNLHRDLLYNVFDGSIGAIYEDARTIMNNINPANGSFFALEQFYGNMRRFYENNYSSTSQIGSSIGALSYRSPTVKKFQNTLGYGSAGSTDEPYGVVYTEHQLTADEQAAVDEHYKDTHTTYLARDTGTIEEFWQDRGEASSNKGRKREEFNKYVLSFVENGKPRSVVGYYWKADDSVTAGYAGTSPEKTIGSAAVNETQNKISYWTKATIEWEDRPDTDSWYDFDIPEYIGNDYIEKTHVIADRGAMELATSTAGYYHEINKYD